MSAVVDLIHATVRLEQPLGDGKATVGTGFIVEAAAPHEAPRVILVTANHVFARMPRDKAQLGLRVEEPKGQWRYAPVSIRIRDAEGHPIWTRHPTQDVAALEIPARLGDAAVSASALAGERSLGALHVQPGDEMMVLGFPRGYSANTAGFPILRSGRVASFPLSPAARYPTFLLDFSVFAGNSGGPVYIVRHTAHGQSVLVTGLLTQQLKMHGDRLEIGNVVQADYVTETLSLMTGAPVSEVSAVSGRLPQADPLPAATGAPPTPLERLRESWMDLVSDARVVLRRVWIVVRARIDGWVSPAARRAPAARAGG